MGNNFLEVFRFGLISRTKNCHNKGKGKAINTARARPFSCAWISRLKLHKCTKDDFLNTC